MGMLHLWSGLGHTTNPRRSKGGTKSRQQEKKQMKIDEQLNGATTCPICARKTNLKSPCIPRRLSSTILYMDKRRLLSRWWNETRRDEDSVNDMNDAVGC